LFKYYFSAKLWMALEEEAQEDENCIIRDARTGQIVMKFNGPEGKQAFINGWKRKSVMLDEGYRCGQCAAYPCFRAYKEDNPAGLCFQPTRRCRQECSLYKCKGYPAAGGICGEDDSVVNYEQDCHIPSMRSKIKK
jgi:hypothetical protein